MGESLLPSALSEQPGLYAQQLAICILGAHTWVAPPVGLLHLTLKHDHCELATWCVKMCKDHVHYVAVTLIMF